MHWAIDCTPPHYTPSKLVAVHFVLLCDDSTVCKYYKGLLAEHSNCAASAASMQLLAATSPRSNATYYGTLERHHDLGIDCHVRSQPIAASRSMSLPTCTRIRLEPNAVKIPLCHTAPWKRHRHCDPCQTACAAAGALSMATSGTSHITLMAPGAITGPSQHYQHHVMCVSNPYNPSPAATRGGSARSSAREAQ